MKFHKQTILHDPDNGQYGDCLRTCIACLFDLNVEEVPHLHDNGAEHSEAMAALDRWLSDYLPDRDVALFRLGLYCSPEHIMQYMAAHNPGMIYLLSGKSPRHDAGHVVIARDRDIIHDPHPDGTGLAGPMVDDEGNETAWVELFVDRWAHLPSERRCAA